MAHPVEWIIDLLEHVWSYNEGTNTIVATTTTVVHTYINLSCMREVVEPNVPLAIVVIPKAPPSQPLAPWDFPLSPLPDIGIEPMFP